jgi:hypothetical protein
MNIDTCCGMENNADKTKVMRFPRQPSLPEILIYQRKLKNVEYFKRLDCLVQNLQVKLNLGSVTKAGFNKNKVLFAYKVSLNI